MMVLLGAMTAGAQSENTGSRWTVTPEVGLTRATFVGDDADFNGASMAWKAGVEAQYKLSRLWSLQTGLLYTRDRVKEYVNITLRDNYFELTLSHHRLTTERLNLPVLLGLELTPGLQLKAGLQADYLLSARVRTHVTGFRRDFPLGVWLEPEDIAALPKLPVDEYESSGIKSDMHNWGLSIPVGVSYEWRSVVLDARYHFGLTHVAHHETDACRRYLSVTLGYRFGL